MDKKSLAQKYTGQVAVNYEKSRSRKRKWCAEQAAIEGFLGKLPNNIKLLDIPAGTGRFFEFYRRFNFRVTAADISLDMLKEARLKAEVLGYDAIHFLESDIFDIDAGDNEFDAAICMRFLNWIDEESLGKVLAELSRVSSGVIMVGIRHWMPMADIRPWASLADFKMLIRQFIKRVGNERGLVFHKKNSVLQIFDDIGISILEAVCIERRRDGTEYYIYWGEVK